MEVFVATTGFCWGIELTYRRLDKLSADGGSVKATHRGGARPEWDPIRRIATGDPELIVRYPRLAHVGVVDHLDAIDGTEIAAIGHQGVDHDLIDAARARGVAVHDFKCPFIVRYDKVTDALVAEGYDLIAFGKPNNHHCLYAQDAATRGGRSALIAEDARAIQQELHDPARKWACVAQVTGSIQQWQRFQAALQASGIPVRIIDTACSDSRDRQAEAAELAARADAVVVVDDGGGATTSVWETCHAINPNTFRYDPSEPLCSEWFSNAKSVAVLCGILVPIWILDRVAADIRKLPSK